MMIYWLRFKPELKVIWTIKKIIESIVYFSANLRIWKMETRRCLTSVQVPDVTDLKAVDFGPRLKATLILVAGRHQDSASTVSVYNACNAIKGSLELLCQAILPVSITHLQFLSYETMNFISMGHDNVQFWVIRHGKELKSRQEILFHNHSIQYTDLQFEHLSNYKINEANVFFSTDSGDIIEYSVNERRIFSQYDLNKNINRSNGTMIDVSAFACTDRFRITGSSNGCVRIWSTDFSQVLIEANYDQSIISLVVSHDQTRVLIATKSGRLGVLNLIDKVHTDLLHTHTKSITDIDYNPQRHELITAGQDGTIRVWNFQNGQLIKEFRSDREIPLRLSYTSDYQRFACGFNNGTIKLFDLSNSRLIAEIRLTIE